jgi:O-antigen ligase
VTGFRARSARAFRTDGGGLAEPAAAAALGAGLAAVAFAGRGGSQLPRLTPVLIGLVLVGGAACAAALLRAPRPMRGGAAVGRFALLAAVTALSIEWSVAPGESWIEANRTLAYLAAFAGAVALANLRVCRAEAVLAGLLLAGAAVVTYALASRVWPAELAELEIYARIGQPFGYWNAVGATAAMALPPALWLGARREGAVAIRSVAVPLTGLLLMALFLTYSRSSLLAAVVVVAAWLAFVPLRLRSVALLLTAAAGAAPVVAWASSRAAFTDDGVELSVREAAATTFGLLLLGLVVVLYGLGHALLRQRERRAVSPRARERTGRALAVAAAVAALVALVAFEPLSGGWGELTSETSVTTGGPERLGKVTSARARYWRDAIDVFEEHPLEGAGAGGFGTAGLRFRDSNMVNRTAHGYVPQTLADLGLAGLALSLALLAVWLASALRAIGVARGGRPPWSNGRIAATALLLAVVAYGIQAALDWTWFVPGPTVMALVAAGWLAGSAPCRAAAPPRGRARIALAAVAGALALAAAWSAWQPERADRRAERAISLASAGEVDDALEHAEDAQGIDPLALKPLFAEGAILQEAGRIDDARSVFRQAVREHPADAQAWLRLADFELEERDDPGAALVAVEQALYLDPMSLAANKTSTDARRRLRP